MSDANSLDYVCQGGCLTIRLRSDNIIRKMEPTVRRIAELIDTQKPRATLIDFRDVPTPTTFLERYQLGEMAGKYLPGRFVATLLRPYQADRGQIGKVVAMNRGALVEVFTDAAAAEAWVRQYTQSGPSA